MISKPEARCLRCGGKFTVLDPIAVGRHAESVTYYAECGCGAAHLTVKHGTVTDILACDPLQITDWTEPPEGSQEDPDYMAI